MIIDHVTRDVTAATERNQYRMTHGLDTKSDRSRSVFAWCLVVISGLSSLAWYMEGGEYWMIAGLTGGVAILVQPRIALWLFLAYQFILYFPISADPHVLAARSYAIGSVNIYPQDAFVALFAALGVIGLGLNAGVRRALLRDPLGKVLLAFIFYQFFLIGIGAFSNVPLEARIRDALLFLIAFIAIYILVFYRDERLFRILRAGRVLTLLLPLFSIYLYATGQTWLTSTGTERVLFIGPNLLYLAVIAYHLTRDRVRSIDLAVVAYMVFGMALTQYRSGLLALLVLVAVVGYQMIVRRDLKNIVIGGISGLIAFAILVGGIVIFAPDRVDQVVARYSETANVEDRNAQARFSMWEVSWEAFKHNPVIGLGFGVSIDSGVPGLEFLADRRWTPHNFIYHVAAVQGAIGVLLVILLHVLVFGRIRKIERISNPGIGRCLMAFFFALVVVNFFNTTFTLLRTSFMFWGMIGLVLSCSTGRARSSRKGQIAGPHEWRGEKVSQSKIDLVESHSA